MEELKLQPQSGLGDLIQLLPTIEKAVELNIDLTIATNHNYVLEPYGNLIKTVPVELKGNFPVINNGFMWLHYDRYGNSSYSDRYFKDVFPNFNYIESLVFTYKRYKTWICKNISELTKFYIDGIDNICVFGYPRAATRHKNSSSPFQCSPNIELITEKLNKSFLNVMAVGNDDLYCQMNTDDIPYFFDIRDKFSFIELCYLILRSKCVISQAGSITTLAGLFGKPTDFLPAKTETKEQHEKHISGIIFPGQEIIN